MRAPGGADPDDVNARDRSSFRRLSRNRHDDDISFAYGTQGFLHLACVEFQRQVVETVGPVGSAVVPQFRLRELVRRGHIFNRPEHWGCGARRTAQLDGCWIDVSYVQSVLSENCYRQRAVPAERERVRAARWLDVHVHRSRRRRKVVEQVGPKYLIIEKADSDIVKGV